MLSLGTMDGGHHCLLPNPENMENTASKSQAKILSVDCNRVISRARQGPPSSYIEDLDPHRLVNALNLPCKQARPEGAHCQDQLRFDMSIM